MSKITKGAIAIGLVAVIAACAPPAEDEFVVLAPEPVTAGPIPTAKY